MLGNAAVGEHHHALKNGDVQTSALAEHVFKTGHAVDLSQSEVLDHHQHTTTCCMLESWYIQHNQEVLNRERGTLRSWTDGHVSTVTLFSFFSFVLLYISFVSIVTNLTHAACMYKDTPRSDWHVPMCIGVESGYLPSIFNLFWLLIFILLYIMHNMRKMAAEF